MANVRPDFLEFVEQMANRKRRSTNQLEAANRPEIKVRNLNCLSTTQGRLIQAIDARNQISLLPKGLIKLLLRWRRNSSRSVSATLLHVSRHRHDALRLTVKPRKKLRQSSSQIRSQTQTQTPTLCRSLPKLGDRGTGNNLNTGRASCSMRFTTSS